MEEDFPDYDSVVSISSEEDQLQVPVPTTHCQQDPALAALPTVNTIDFIKSEPEESFGKCPFLFSFSSPRKHIAIAETNCDCAIATQSHHA